MDLTTLASALKKKSSASAPTGGVGTRVSNFNFGNTAVAGWPTVGAGAGGFVGMEISGNYTDLVDRNTQTGAVEDAVYRTLLARTSANGSASFTIPTTLTSGANYVARVHIWMPSGFDATGIHAWNIDMNGGTAKSVTTSPNQVRVIDIPFAAGASNVLNFSANTSNVWKVVNGLEIFNAA